MAVGVLRSGGDQFAKRSVAGLPDKSSRVVALFSGIVRLDADGAATVHFDIPDFQGQLRLMAVAFSAHKVGSGERRDDRARPGGDDGVAAALSGAGRHRADRARHQQSRRRRRRLPAEVRGQRRRRSFAAPVERTIPLDKGQGFNGSFPLVGDRRPAMSRCIWN